MADTKTLRVLSLDGGGTRGYLSATFLSIFCQRAGIDPTQLYKTFDVITGSSIGGIQALGYANGFTPDQLKLFLRNDGPWIFSTSSLLPGIRATTLDKVATMLLGGSFYANDNLIAKLNEEFGTLALTDMKTSVVIPAYRVETDSPVLFSNVNFPGSYGQDALVKEVALATASAPLYFKPGKVGDYTYDDGGIFMNNPASMGLAVGKMLKPQANRFCVLSVGTGRGDIGFDKDPTPPPAPGPDDPPAKPFYANISKVFKLIGIGITGPQEAIALDLKIRSEYTVQENLYHYRFQYDLDVAQDTELDNSTADIFNYYDQSGVQHTNDDAVNITNFIGHLTL